MGEWMSAEAHVAVPADVDLNPWLRTETAGEFSRVALHQTADGTAPAPIDALLATAGELGFQWEWEHERRLLTDGCSDLQVNYGLGDEFTTLGDALRQAGWGYHFESTGKYEIPGECWEWMPGWPAERQLTQAGEVTALDACALRAAITEARDAGVDLAQHLTALLAPWPGWHHTEPNASAPAVGPDLSAYQAMQAVADDYESVLLETLAVRADLLWQCPIEGWVNTLDASACDGCGTERGAPCRYPNCDAPAEVVEADQPLCWTHGDEFRASRQEQ